MTGPDTSNFDLDIDASTRETLAAYSFDEAKFRKLQSDFGNGAMAAANNRITGKVELPTTDDIVALAEPGTDEAERLAELGRQAIASQAVAASFLVGGMATRFGGVVKAAVDVAESRSFLDLKLADVRMAARRYGGQIPVFLMTSFATHDRVCELVDQLRHEDDIIEVFAQNVSLRLDADAQLFKDEHGRAAMYAPGHGDFPGCIAASGHLDRFISNGGKIVTMSNVDNILAGIDPVVIGAHIDSGCDMTVEVTDNDGVPGGAPARVDGRCQIVEHFRFPTEFASSQIAQTSTNTFLFNAQVLLGDYPLTWFVVEKGVDGRTAIQFERLVGEVTAFVSTQMLEVPRLGPGARFQPIKDPGQLDENRERLIAIMADRGLI